MSIALVLGGAACVWADALAVAKLVKPELNHRGQRHDPALAWAT